MQNVNMFRQTGLFSNHYIQNNIEHMTSYFDAKIIYHLFRINRIPMENEVSFESTEKNIDGSLRWSILMIMSIALPVYIGICTSP